MIDKIMFLPIKPICDRRTRRDGTSQIYIQYCFSSEKRTLLATGLAIPNRFWNKRVSRIANDIPEQFGDSSQMNFQLQRMVRVVEDIVHFALDQKMEDPLEFLKLVFYPEFDPSTLLEKAKQIANEKQLKRIAKLDFFYQVDDYIRTKSSKVSEGMLKAYRGMKNRLIGFEKHSRTKITFGSLDFNFYEAFVNYLTYDHVHMRRNITLRGLKKNSVGASIKQLRIFLRDRIRRKIIQPIDLSDFKILDEQTDAIYLSTSEIRTLYDLDLSGYQYLSKYRDLFVLGCSRHNPIW